MGRDKAALLIEGQPLWQRQLAILQATRPRELFIAGPRDGACAAADAIIVPDATPDLGPLAGLEAALAQASEPFVLVLAIDLPRMTSRFLATLIALAEERVRGVVPRLGPRFEPLAAVYPRGCLPLVREHLQSADRSLQAFVRATLVLDLVVPRDIAAPERELFRNLNTPVDLLGL